MKSIKIVLISFALFALLGCVNFDEVYMKDELKKAMITGKVITEEGLPLEGAIVKLNELQETKTDINGRFLFNFVKYGEYNIIVKKEEYNQSIVNFHYTFKTRKDNFIKVKLKSLNYLINEAIEFLKEKNFQKVQNILNEIEKISADDQTVLYLKAMYFYYGARYESAMKILEDLRYQDRKIVYYSLALIKCYDALRLYLKEATLCYYIGKNFKEDYAFLIKRASDLYKEKMNNIGMSKKMLTEYEKNM